MGLREFKVGTFCGDGRREEAENRTRFIKSDIGALIGVTVHQIQNYIAYRIEASSSTEAKKIAIDMRLLYERTRVDIDGWGWWRNV